MALPDAAAEEPDMEVGGCTASTLLTSGPSQHASPSTHQGDSDTDRIAQAVAALLAPMITASMEKAVDAGMRQFKKQLGEHATRLNEVEHRLSSVAEDM